MISSMIGHHVRLYGPYVVCFKWLIRQRTSTFQCLNLGLVNTRDSFYSANINLVVFCRTGFALSVWRSVARNTCTNFSHLASSPIWYLHYDLHQLLLLLAKKPAALTQINGSQMYLFQSVNRYNNRAISILNYCVSLCFFVSVSQTNVQVFSFLDNVLL